MPPKKNKTIAELKEECKKKGIKGYSGKKKDDLIKLCSRSSKKGSSKKGSSKKGSSKKGSSKKKSSNKDMTVAELKEECKKKGIKGYSGKTKSELIKLLSSKKKGSSSKKKSSSSKKSSKKSSKNSSSKKIYNISKNGKKMLSSATHDYDTKGKSGGVLELTKKINKEIRKDLKEGILAGVPVSWLKYECKRKGITGYHSKNKAQLIEMCT